MGEGFPQVRRRRKGIPGRCDSTGKHREVWKSGWAQGMARLLAWQEGTGAGHLAKSLSVSFGHWGAK